jgi:hypothetical protein
MGDSLGFRARRVGLSLAVMAAGLILLVLSGTSLGEPAALSGDGSLPPIVFVSRNYLNTLGGYYVGPPVDVSGREYTVGGTVNLLRPDGEVVVLAGSHNGIYDAQQPAVSFDGTRVAFSGVKARNGMYRIFEVKIDGTGLRQLTPDALGFDIPEDPRLPKANASSFARFGDFAPAYLPDGRIVFSSSRYPSISGSCGQRGLTLFIMNGDGGGMRRIVSTRTGAYHPWVMADGRILYAMWADNMNVPSYSTEGLQPLEGDRSFGSSFFEPWAVNPDGTGTGRVGFLAGFLTHGSGAGANYREMPNGEIVYTRRSSASFLGSTLASSIAKFRPGDGTGNSIAGVGDPVNLDASHAMAPTPLADGRILFSYTPTARSWQDEQKRLYAEFDFGLYVCDGDFQNLRPVYDRPGTQELDPVAVYPRKAAKIPDAVATAPEPLPSPPIQRFAVFESRSVYADIDRRFTHALSPLPGSVVAIDVYDDAQTFTTSNEFPFIRKQMPRFFKSFPVNPDGSFRAEIPADRPVFYFLRGPTGVAARHQGSYAGEIRTPMFGHEQLRPGEVLTCTGCHRGHMIRPELSPSAQVNWGRLAVAQGSSTRDASYMGPGRVLDGYLGQETGRYQWVPAATDLWPWVRLVWDQHITIREFTVYPRPGVQTSLGEIEIFLSSGRRFQARPEAGKADQPFSVKVPDPAPITWAHLQLLSFPTGGAPGIAELTAHGDPVEPGGDSVPLPVPSAAVAAGSLRLSWSRSPSPSVLGYKIFAGPSPDNLYIEWDVANSTSYQPEYLQPGEYYFQVRPYNFRRFGPAQTKELKAELFPPRIDRVTPDRGPWWGETDIVIEGANFVSGLSAKIGGEWITIKSVTPQKIVGLTRRYSAGTFDVMVRNPGMQEYILFKAFKYE